MVNNPQVSFSYAAMSVRQKGAFINKNNKNSLFESGSSKKSDRPWFTDPQSNKPAIKYVIPAEAQRRAGIQDKIL